MPPREVGAAKAAPKGGEHRSDDEDADSEDPEASKGGEDEGTGNRKEGASTMLPLAHSIPAPYSVLSSQRQGPPTA